MRPRPPVLRLLASLAALSLAAPASAQLGIDLTPDENKDKKPAQDKKPPAAKPPPKTEVMPELDLNAPAKKGEGTRRVAEANKVFQGGDFELAALAYDAILRDPGLAEAHDEARYGLAKSLIRLGLYHSALVRLEEILARGPQGTKYFHNALEWLFHVGKRVTNDSVVVGAVARYASGAFPPSSQDEYAYLLARYAYERGQALDDAGRAGEAKKAWDEARRLAATVRQDAGAAAKPRKPGEPDAEDGDLYARARFLEGLVRYATADSQGAVESFKDVVRLTNPRRGRVPDPRIRELAFQQLARIHYEYKQNRYAIFYYDKMPWGGESWLEGLWESSYAHYRIGDYEKALGNLLTLQSPYFRDEWFPESWILKAIIYYENCRYPEARAILDEFHGTFEPVHAELDRMTTRNVPPSAFYDLIGDAQRGGGARPVMRRILKAAFTDGTVKRLGDSIAEVDREMDVGLGGRREAFRGSALAKDLRERLAGEKKKLVDEAGARARAKLEYERDGLKDLLQQALRIKIEVSRKEREALEGSLTGGPGLETLRNYRFSTAVSDEHLYWPYDGEFWRDELGTYTYTLTKGCRDAGARAVR
ncbi:MAG TPA: adventurous gliding motility protein GltC [Anaeromyxobacteraceae bacterium]|nr:adventurous gliding motility protein GltC [Anaeromyxobacteraceae bacterium]